VLVLVVGIVALVGRGSSSNQNTALSAKAPSASASAPVAAGAAGPSGAEKFSTGSDGVVDAGDLGTVADVAALRSLVAAGVTAAATAAPSAARPASGNDAVLAPTVPVPRQVGTRVCEVEARTARPQLGVVVYSATARFAGTAAQVLGFGPTPGARPTELLVLAPQDGCRILAETTVS
jgi:hypothetical protein